MIFTKLSFVFPDQNEKKTGLQQNKRPVVFDFGVVFFLSPRRLFNYYYYYYYYYYNYYYDYYYYYYYYYYYSNGIGRNLKLKKRKGGHV